MLYLFDFINLVKFLFNLGLKNRSGKGVKDSSCGFRYTYLKELYYRMDLMHVQDKVWSIILTARHGFQS